MTLQPFHLAIPVNDLTLARQFYGELLGCAEGRSAERWIDFNFFGHQLVCHLSSDAGHSDSNRVDDHDVPVPHFGIVLEMTHWHQLANTFKAAAIDFIIEPYTRFVGEPGEQATMFLLDPSGNALEFKAFKNIEQQLFSK